MIEDLRRLEAGAELEADLCVIGAGAAGIAIALQFADSRTDVLVLESGGLRQEGGTESLNAGETAGIDGSSLTEGRARVLGGATALWAGQCLPPDDAMFAERGWVPFSGWPFPLAEVEPHLRQAESLFQIAGEAYDERVWDEFGVVRPATDHRRVGHRFTVWCPEPHLGRLYRRRLADSRSVRVLLNATATGIRTNAAGRAFESVDVATPEGRPARVRARACVICCGAVENSRLLLASTDARPGGLGNEHDLVGRFFQEHPNGHTATIEGADVPALQELYGMRYRGKVRFLPRLVLSPEVQRAEQVLSCAAHPVFEFGDESGVEAARRVYRSIRARRRPARLRDELPRIARDAPRLASVAFQRLAHGRSARLAPARVTLQTYAEQAPNPDSRVTLSRDRDRLGVPLPRLEWRLTELDRRTHEAMVGTVGGEFERLGLGAVQVEPWLAATGWEGHLSDAFHHMGTTRLGTDPRTSVVDPVGGLHDVAGLFVAGSSVFPASGYVNPTLLIVALAGRLASHLAEVLAQPTIDFRA
jgi:choline dehydrogenase-like flavoprotein